MAGHLSTSKLTLNGLQVSIGELSHNQVYMDLVNEYVDGIFIDPCNYIPTMSVGNTAESLNREEVEEFRQLDEFFQSRQDRAKVMLYISPQVHYIFRGKSSEELFFDKNQEGEKRHSDLAKAISLAAVVHSGMERKSSGIINFQAHQREIGIRCLQKAADFGMDYKMAGTLGFLHDVVEEINTEMKLDFPNSKISSETVYKFLYKMFDPKIVDQLKFLTMDINVPKWNSESDIDYDKRLDITRGLAWQRKVKGMHAETALVKLVDLIANSDGLKLRDEKLTQRLMIIRAINDKFPNHYGSLVNEFYRKNSKRTKTWLNSSNIN